MGRQVLTITFQYGLVEVHNQANEQKYYFDAIHYAYHWLTGSGVLEPNYVVYIDTYDGLDRIENDGDWAVALLKYNESHKKAY